ncbi:MAG: hypothetical protein JOZ15_20650 [Acidobacteria bacterium]|nr:hypothetical protein [Acidobacteriota bacterium]
MRWFEIVVEGDADAWEALLVQEEARSGQRAVRGLDVPLRPESLGERLHELPHDRTHHAAFAPDELGRALAATLTAPAAPAAAEAAEAAPTLRLEQLREVTGGHFAFTVEAFAEPVAQQIRAVLASPPHGVEVRSRDEEARDPEAGAPGAVQLYAPLHCYAYRAWGTVAGPFPGILDIHRRLRALPFVYEEKIELAAHRVELADLEPA